MTAKNIFVSKRGNNAANQNQHKIKYPEIARQVISESDIVLEILDSRFWKETRNFEFEKQIKKQKKRLIFIFNKSDLIDRKKLIKEIDENSIYPYVFVSCKSRKGSSDLRKRIQIEAKKIDKDKIYVGLIGYPNTGKSSVINLLRGHSVARVASESGFTKGMQKVKITEKIYLIDTPGVIPSSENSNLSVKDLVKHAQINVRMWDKVKEPEMIVDDLMKKYPELFEKFYKIKANGNSEILIEKLGRKKGFLLKGDEIDRDRTSRLILRNFQEGRIRV
ncbi:50S ribosome-binding GTPase [Candidatus Woesearchaeota archaeon]|nr:50S ribosome-binding GTPase [Candidatus Woesearchaeota archaeon]